jgi:hypothetical protein
LVGADWGYWDRDTSTQKQGISPTNFYDSSANPSIAAVGFFYDTTYDSIYGFVKNGDTGTSATATEMKTLATFNGSAAWDIVNDASLSDVYPQLRWATSGLSAGSSIWVVGRGMVNYSVAGGTQTYGTGFTLPTPVITGGTPTATPTVKVYDSNNNDVTSQAIAGTLAAGTYTVKTLLTDTNYQLASSGNADGVLTITSIAASGSSPSDRDTAIANAIAVPHISLPSGATTGADQPRTFVNVTTPLPQVSAAFGPGERFAVVSSPNANEPTQGVTLSQARAMMQSPGQTTDGNRDVRVPVSRNSLAEIVNGGLKLPDGVEQELFVVQAN